MAFTYYQPAGVAAEVDPTALKIANDLSDLNSDALARANLGLTDLATTWRAVLREVTNAAGAADGDLLTANGAGSYAWETPVGGVTAGFIQEITFVEMGAPVDNAVLSENLNVSMGGPGPYYVREVQITQVGGDYAAGTPSLALVFYFDDARAKGWPGFYFPPAALPSVGTTALWGHDEDGTDEIHLVLSDSTSSGDTAQYRVTLTVDRPRVAADG